MRPGGPKAIATLVSDLRCVQLDPLDPMGTNADLVAMARLDDVRRGDFAAYAYGAAFEHFAKERCLLPADAFPFYAAAAPRRPTFRMGTRLERVPASVLEETFRFVERNGPIGAEELDLGKVTALDWHGWKGTNNTARMALEVLVRQCRVCVSGRVGRRKLFDLPARHLGALGKPSACSAGEFSQWAILERVRSAGLLSLGAGIWWSSIEDRHAAEALVADGRVQRVEVEGIRAPLLAEPGLLEAARSFVPSSRLRALGPLDPLLWNRRLVLELFGFEYLWEVYKPAAQRRHGWYVMPLLLGEELVGRIEGRVVEGLLDITNIWEESRGAVSKRKLDAFLAHHAWACGVDHFRRPTTWCVG